MTLFTNLPSVHDRGHGERMALVLELRPFQGHSSAVSCSGATAASGCTAAARGASLGTLELNPYDPATCTLFGRFGQL